MNLEKLINTAKNTFDTISDNVAKNKQETKLKISYKGAFTNESNTIRKDVNGNFYIGSLYSETATRYSLEHIEFDGSKVTKTTTSKTNTSGTKSSNAKKALAGGLLLGPVGALAGASGKKKVKSTAVTQTKENITETPGKGKIHLRSNDDGKIKTLKFMATTNQYANIERFFKQ